VAPPAIERTPFKKNSRPDAGAVMNGIFLNPEYYPAVRIHIFPRHIVPESQNCIWDKRNTSRPKRNEFIRSSDH
jgi:hypothetical protein